jgi:hypothetical protein
VYTTLSAPVRNQTKDNPDSPLQKLTSYTTGGLRCHFAFFVEGPQSAVIGQQSVANCHQSAYSMNELNF